MLFCLLILLAIVGVVFHDSDLSTAEYPVACTSSDTSLKAISEISQLHNKIPIVVAHKETIKMLSGDVQTPYCCIGVYQYLLEAVNSTSIRNDRSKNSEEELDQKASSATEKDLESSSPFSLIHLYDRNGIAVQSIDTN